MSYNIRVFHELNIINVRFLLLLGCGRVPYPCLLVALRCRATPRQCVCDVVVLFSWNVVVVLPWLSGNGVIPTIIVFC